jgi:hypothetical protein
MPCGFEHPPWTKSLAPQEQVNGARAAGWQSVRTAQLPGELLQVIDHEVQRLLRTQIRYLMRTVFLSILNANDVVIDKDSYEICRVELSNEIIWGGASHDR